MGGHAASSRDVESAFVPAITRPPLTSRTTPCRDPHPQETAGKVTGTAAEAVQEAPRIVGGQDVQDAPADEGVGEQGEQSRDRRK